MISSAHGHRVLVTGATGFLGGPVTRALIEAGHEVHGIARNGESDAFVVHRVDMLDTKATEAVVADLAPTHLVHLAWTTSHGLFWRDPANLDWAAATMSLVRSFQQSGGRRAVLVGSCAEYDWSRAGPYAEAAAGPAPETLYGAAKLATGLATTAFGAETGIELAWARLFHLYGPGEDAQRVVPLLFDAASRGMPLQLDHHGNVVDLMHIDDAADALVEVLHSDLVGPVNVATGTPTTLGSVARLVSDLVGVEHPGHSEAPTASRQVHADTSRLRNEVHIRTPRAPEDGLANVWNQYRCMDRETP